MGAHRPTLAAVLVAVLFAGGVVAPSVHWVQHTAGPAVPPAAAVGAGAAATPGGEAGTSPVLPGAEAADIQTPAAESDAHSCFWCTFHVVGQVESATAADRPPRASTPRTASTGRPAPAPHPHRPIRGPPSAG